MVQEQEQKVAQENRTLLALRQYLSQIQGGRSDRSQTTYALETEVEGLTL
jgi:hypothetical protein